jgi:hypothetical protein
VELKAHEAALAAALGVTSSAISQWPEELDQARADRVFGAMLRLGLLYNTPLKPYVCQGQKADAA